MRCVDVVVCCGACALMLLCVVVVWLCVFVFAASCVVCYNVVMVLVL